MSLARCCSAQVFFALLVVKVRRLPRMFPFFKITRKDSSLRFAVKASVAGKTLEQAMVFATNGREMGELCPALGDSLSCCRVAGPTNWIAGCAVFPGLDL